MNPKTCISTGDFRHSWKYCIWCSFGEIKFNLTEKIKIYSTYYDISRACVNEIILMTSLQKKKKKKKEKREEKRWNSQNHSLHAYTGALFFHFSSISIDC